MPILLFAAAAALQPAPVAAPVAIPDQPILTEQIRAADADLFELFFSGPCDSGRLRAMLAPDIEFYHDRAGFNVRSPDDFVAIFETNCAERQQPGARSTRRALVPESLHVDPVPGHGAIEVGEHLFYEREGDGPERLAGRARFAQLWVLGPDGAWRLSRVLSYAHRPPE